VPDEAGPLSGFGSGWPSAGPRRLRRGDKEEHVLASMEETLSFAVSERSAKLVRLPMTASRRLQLSAEKREPWVRSFDADGDRRRPPTSANRPRQRPGGV
jgi:protein ImuA